MDNTQLGSVEIAIEKSRSAALFRRPTKVFEDAVAGGRNAILALHGAVPIEGGVPIISGGKIVGAVGGTAPQDGQVAKAGAVDAARDLPQRVAALDDIALARRRLRGRIARKR